MLAVRQSVNDECDLHRPDGRLRGRVTGCDARDASCLTILSRPPPPRSHHEVHPAPWSPHAEETRRSNKRSNPERRTVSESVEPALESGATQPGSVADPDQGAKQRITPMAGRVDAAKVPGRAAMAASTAVGNASIGRTAAAAQVAAPAAAGPSSAAAQGSNSWLRDLHQVGYASAILQIGLLSHCHERQSLLLIGLPVCCLLAAPLSLQQQSTVCPHHALRRG